MAIPTGDELRRWFVEILTGRGESLRGVSVHVEQLGPDEAPDVVVEYTGDPPAPPEMQTVVFKVELVARRMTEDEAAERLPSVREAITLALGEHHVLPGAAEYEGIGEVSEVQKDPVRRVVLHEFRVYLGFEKSHG